MNILRSAFGLVAAAVSQHARDKMGPEDFAVPGKQALLINDAKHTRLAWDMVDRTGGLTPEEKSTARHRILERAKQQGVDTSNWDTSLAAAAGVDGSFGGEAGNRLGDGGEGSGDLPALKMPAIQPISQTVSASPMPVPSGVAVQSGGPGAGGRVR